MHSFLRGPIRAALLILVLLITPLASADDLRITTINAYLFFKPGSETTGGRLANKGPHDLANYSQKVTNLATMTMPSDVIALQEVGSAIEVQDLAHKCGATAVFVQGRDTYTGEDVGFIHYLRRGFRAVHYGRVPMLDRVISKHLLLVVDGPQQRFNILNVHLIRATTDPDKNAAQRMAIESWLDAARAKEPDSVFIIVGDMNVDQHGPVFALGRDILQDLSWDYTHSQRLVLDHMVIVGKSHWENAAIVKPPYGPRPNNLNKMLWSDHFAVSGFVTPD